MIPSSIGPAVLDFPQAIYVSLVGAQPARHFPPPPRRADSRAMRVSSAYSLDYDTLRSWREIHGSAEIGPYQMT